MKKSKIHSYPNNHLKELAKTTLINLKPSVTSDDRRAVKFVNERTVIRYLSGEIGDLGIAEKLISFFSKRIQAREKLFMKANELVKQ